MVKQSLHRFAERLLDRGCITDSDVAELANTLLADDLMHRAEADLIIALDRLVADKAASWDRLYVRLLTAYVVWTSRPTGKVDQDAALWLATALSAGNGPTENGLKAALDIVREAEQVDEALIAFVLDGQQAARAQQPISRTPNPPSRDIAPAEADQSAERSAAQPLNPPRRHAA